MTKRKGLSICFVSPFTYPLLAASSSIEHVGGAELQQAILAKALAKEGYDVSMICLDYGQESEQIIEGVKVYRAYNPKDGLPVIRFFYPRLTSIVSCMEKANADIYYQRCSGMLTGIVAKYCKSNNKKFIFAGASNDDFAENSPKLTNKKDKFLYQYGLRRVSQVFVQNEEQKELLAKNYTLGAEVVNNAYDVPADAKNDKAGYILWVSTIREVKRPELFLELVRSLPQFQFKMVGGPGDKELYKKIKKMAIELDNLEFMGFVPFTQVEEHYNHARLVINTSTVEGFPNAFLQAWSREIPSVSFYDCGARTTNGDEVCDRVDTIDEMKVRVKELMECDELWHKRGEQASGYYESKHSVSSVVGQISSIVDKFA